VKGQQNSVGVGEYWLQSDSGSAIQYMEGYHSKWSIWVNSPIRQAWVRNFISYYSPVITPSSWDSSQVFEGTQSELIKYFTPKSRSLMRQLVSLITKQRMTYQAMAMTSGSDVINDVKLANSLIDQIIQIERLDIKGEELVENALIMGGGFTKTSWRTDRGEPYTMHNGKIIYTGGVEISIISVFDMYYDIDIPHWDQLDWAECRTIKNRWDLIAQHPDLEDELKSLQSLYEARGPNYWFDRNKQNDDLVSIYEMYAKPSPSLPKGRLLIYGDENTVLYDGENIYGCIPLEPMIPEKVMNTGFGYPKFTDIAASQEQYDNCLSAIATNNAQFAVQSVTVPRGANINVQELNGMRFVSFTPQGGVAGGGKPEPMQMTQSSPETYKFIDILSGIMSEISGVHPALTGNLSAGATSGVAIATLTANAMEFINSIAKTYHICMEKTMLHAVNCYKNFAKLPQEITSYGKNNQAYRKKITKDDFQNINGIRVIVSNPLMQTIAGRLEIAEKMMQIPKELWPDYVSVLEGRPLEDTFKGELSQADLIYTENEHLMDGRPVIALATDDHGMHVQRHSQLLNDPHVRFNNQRIEEILNHIEEHVKLAQDTDPFLMAMVRTGKVPQQGEPQDQGGGGGGKPPGLSKDLANEPEIQPSLPAEDLLNRAQ